MSNSHDEIKRLVEASRKMLSNTTLNEDINSIRKKHGIINEQDDLISNNVTQKVNVTKNVEDKIEDSTDDTPDDKSQGYRVVGGIIVLHGKDNNDFINRGKTSFNTYVADLSNEESKKNPDNAASTNGFIPVELGLTVDGLSGVKIYQKLEITQRFLPVSYSKALRFVIRGVNHTVSGNQWVTDLSTISTSVSDQKSSVEAAKSYGAKADASVSAKTPTRVLGPIPPKNPNEKLKIYDNRTVAGVPFDKRTYKTYQGIDWLVGEMNNNTQNQWRGFLNALNERYPGYELRINATYRSYQRSIQLKQINSNNATAGKSPHNYAYGIDMNVKDPSGKVYYKKDKKKLSKEMRDAIERGLKHSAYDYANAIDFIEQSYQSYKEVFEDYHGIISPSASGVADKGLKSTGSADFQKTWTYLGLPTISLPLLTGENNLPLGVQLTGNKLDDLRFLSIANWLEKNCKDE